MSYFDVFILPVPKSNLTRYKAFAQMACDVWMEHGALQYVETVGDDVPDGKVTSLPMSVKLKKNEAVAVGYVVYKSRAHRDQVSKKVFADPRMQFDWKDAPFDGLRMMFGGFSQLLAATANTAKGKKPVTKATPRAKAAAKASAKPAGKPATKTKRTKSAARAR